MTVIPSGDWADVFPGPRIPDVLLYVSETWDWLQQTYSQAVAFTHGETVLTDNLCEALEDPERRRSSRMDCDFQPETWVLQRQPDGKVTRVARADIRVILGAPGTPHLVMEFKKLDGSADSHWRYCFDGLNRFVEGKYAVDHPYGVMCGFTCADLNDQATALAAYIGQEEYARRLACLPDATGKITVAPSLIDPASSRFDTNHARRGVGAEEPIILLHTLLHCPQSPAMPASDSC